MSRHRALRGLTDLALALASGKNAMQPFRGAPSVNHAEKDTLNAPIAGLECYIDRIASYISCYSPLMDREKAGTLFTRLIDDLQGGLPSDTWKGIKKDPGMSSTLSYIYQHQDSNAHVDIDILARPGLGGQSSYMVSFFGWPR